MDIGIAGDGCGDNFANGLGRFEGHLTKLFGAAHMRVFHQHSVGMTHLGGKMFCNLLCACCTQAGSAGFDISTANLRHPGRRRSLTWGIGKDMQPSQVTVAHQFEAVFKDVKERDERDATRHASPLKAASDAIIIDTTKLTIEAAVKNAIKVVATALERIKQP